MRLPPEVVRGPSGRLLQRPGPDQACARVSCVSYSVKFSLVQPPTDSVRSKRVLTITACFGETVMRPDEASAGPLIVTVTVCPNRLLSSSFVKSMERVDVPLPSTTDFTIVAPLSGR